VAGLYAMSALLSCEIDPSQEVEGVPGALSMLYDLFIEHQHDFEIIKSVRSSSSFHVTVFHKVFFKSLISLFSSVSPITLLVWKTLTRKHIIYLNFDAEDF
jgi:hypothetical protein